MKLQIKIKNPFLITSVFVLASCSNSGSSVISGDEISVAEVTFDSLREERVFEALLSQKENPNRVNYTDKNGLKQGKWEELGWKNRLAGFVHYVNDTLNGPWLSQHGITVSGFYKNGKKEGYERHFYHNDADSNTLALGYYKDGISLWFAHPNADQGLLMLSKKFSVHVDSVFVSAPFRSGGTWYEGLFLKQKPVGKHTLYYPNKKLHGIVDYAKETFVEYDSLGNLLRAGHLDDLTFVKRFGIGSN